MPNYLILAHPGHGKVYFDEAGAFALKELSLAGTRFDALLTDVHEDALAGIDYIAFTAEGLTEKDLRSIGRLSFFYALYEEREGCLRPVAIPECWYLEPGISGMLKYSGKTNELFTRMMINAAVCATAFDPDGALRVLDPLAGKGTTLFECLARGYDASGMEIGEKTVEEVCRFFKQYLERGRMKHEVKADRIVVKERGFSANRRVFTFSRDKEAFKNDEVRELTVVSGNSRYADRVFKKRSFHLIIGDLPYGVQHSSVTNEKQSSFTRNPGELLSGCLPAWREVLREGGAIALSWNTFVITREKVASLLTANGFRLCEGEAFKSLAHRVDQAINRDLIIGIKE